MSGHTLLIDSAYSLYADETHAWADTILEAIEEGMLWPENLLVSVAVSLSKSHTIYGLRTGALVCMHPEKEVTNRMETVLCVTARQTWSATPRVSQYSVSEMHSSEEGVMHGVRRDVIASSSYWMIEEISCLKNVKN